MIKAQHAHTRRRYPLISLACLLVVIVSAIAQGQTPANPRTEPGKPVGSYSVDGLDSINYFNGRMHFGLPLLKVGGRGGAEHTINLIIDPQWPGEGKGCPNCPNYFPLWAGQYDYDAGYGAGVMEIVFDNMWVDNGCTGPGYGLVTNARTTLRFKGPDGTETVFADTIFDGQSMPSTPGPNDGCEIYQVDGRSRGKVFVSKDGPSTTFISDTDIHDNRWASDPYEYRSFPSGYLKFSNGTVYRIDLGNVTWSRDRNGNKIAYEYYPPDAPYAGNYHWDGMYPGKVKKITDSLGRIVQFTYDNPTGVATERFDEITYNGFGAQSRVIRVYYARLEHALREPATLQDYCQLQLDCTTLFGGGPYPANPLVVSSIVLPNNQSYHFYYDKYAELTRFEVPGGGAVEFEYNWGLHDQDFYALMGDTYRRVVERRSYPSGGNGLTFESKTIYRETEVTGNYPTFQLLTLGYFDVDHIARVNGIESLISRERHYYNGLAGDLYNTSENLVTGGYWYASYQPWNHGREFKTEYMASDGETVLRRVETTWQQNPTSWWTAQEQPPINNPRVVETVTTVTDVTPNLVSKQSAINPNTGAIGFDQYNNPTDVWEYDYGAGSPGALLRRTHTDYVTDPAYTDAQTGSHLRQLPAQVIVYDGNNNALTKNSFAYDEVEFPLFTYGAVTGWSDPNTPKRGNPTTVSNWLNTNNTWLSAHTRFDQLGNVRMTWSPSDTTRINPTQIEYSSDYHFAYPTLQTSADPDLTTAGNGPALPLTSISTYDLSTGLLTQTTDPNGSISQFQYVDSLDRLTRSITALNTTAQSESVINYDDANRKVTRFNDLNFSGDSVLKSETLYDGFGRVIETRSYEGPSNYIAVQTHYDVLGRVDKTSNSFRPLQSETPVWTTTLFDALGRPISRTMPDGAVVNTAYSGNRVLLDDPQHRIRITVTDAFQRLRELWEVTPADGATESVSFPGYPAVAAGYVTRYGYDGVNNLTSVSQRFGPSGTNQSRSFTFDSLKRLTAASNPESGTINLAYDSDSNLTSQTDARGTVSTYVYDALNRTTSVDYSNTAVNPDVTQSYDGATNGKGRLWKSYAGGSESVGSNVEKTLFESYDPLGRPSILKQFFKLNGVWSNPYQVSRAYNLSGGVTSQTYPSNRVVTYNYDSAARLADKDAQNPAVAGNLGGTSRTYSSEISYVAAGLLKQERFGTTTGVYKKLFYNLRLQLTGILANTTGDNSTWDRGKILNQYSMQCSGLSCDAPDNNGSLRKQEIYIPAGGQVPSPVSWYQQYDYDDLNRLKRVHEYTGNTSLDWQQEYVYDRWSNRTISASNTWVGNSNNPPNPSLNEKQFDTGLLATTNRLYAPGDVALADNQRQMSYDAAGNLTKDIYTGFGTATFDANNRMTAIQDNTGSSSNYIYNVEGQRTRRISSNQETWQIYGFAGELIAEYPANGPVSTPTREYGYRNGQLLVVATITGGWGAAPTIHDNPLQTGVTTVQALHITELRTAINALRSHLSMPAYSWTTAATTADWITAPPILEMRTALDQALGAPTNGYAAGLAQNQPVLAIHIQELRDRVLAAWQNGSSVDLRWLLSDQLGTPRLVFDQSGSAANMNRHDYLPFGEELIAGMGLRTTGQRYMSDTLRQKFTLKERDTETNLDYFVARYLSSVQGRFTGADPGAGMPGDAQSWNRYSYARNSPLDMGDPDGRTFVVCDPEGHNCVTYSDDEFYRIRRETDKQYGYTGDRDFFEQGAITENGEVLATYRQVSIDPSGENGRARQLAYHMRRAINDPKTMMKAAANIIFIRLLQNRTGSNTTGSGGPNKSLSFEEMSGMLRGATKQKGNFGMGTGSRAEAQAMGEAWVGVGYRVASDGKTLVSADGLRVFRPPSWKPQWNMEQANFEWRVTPGGVPTGNGHLDIW